MSKWTEADVSRLVRKFRRLTLKGEQTVKSKHLTDVEIDGINFRDAPDFADAFVSAAAWADSGKDLTDDELDELNDSDQRFRLIENYIY